ncbi:HD-domain/PDEase-like protein [Piromyces finnis]|uniref:Guanosine-3',5'-bis(diphosphate) 3'-pyrophosphohydrolase MESH1 n=1 Tax=Piromyces finnis TaxID=1754191 RepID=A0A1Y1V196_9FUNG|nr:HD-domain/PDEase-like protein [Piromyces finnis]|eukprot:ORX45048.1 HD-domain/PDEase-like protein [Piromyces finnis]
MASLVNCVDSSVTVMSGILKAMNFAALKHSFQKRKDAAGTPYINHPIGVANILFFEGGVKDLVTIQAAILHDTVEDTDTSFDEITANFGSEVTDVVKEVTDDKSLPSAERKRLQVVTAPHKSDRGKAVKMADKIYNLRDLQKSVPIGWSIERAQQYFSWAQKVTNGCRGINSNLEQILDNLYSNGKIIYEGKEYPAIPKQN